MTIFTSIEFGGSLVRKVYLLSCYLVGLFKSLDLVLWKVKRSYFCSKMCHSRPLFHLLSAFMHLINVKKIHLLPRSMYLKQTIYSHVSLPITTKLFKRARHSDYYFHLILAWQWSVQSGCFSKQLIYFTLRNNLLSKSISSEICSFDVPLAYHSVQTLLSLSKPLLLLLQRQVSSVTRWQEYLLINLAVYNNLNLPIRNFYAKVS